MNTADNQSAALKLFKRPNGASVDMVAAKLDLPNVKAARGLVDRLREKGVKIKNVGNHTFKAHKRSNPKS